MPRVSFTTNPGHFAHSVCISLGCITVFSPKDIHFLHMQVYAQQYLFFILKCYENAIFKVRVFSQLGVIAFRGRASGRGIILPEY